MQTLPLMAAHLVVVRRALDGSHRHEPLHTLIRDAFGAAARQLEQRVERRRAS